MAFAFVVDKSTFAGEFRKKYGTFTNATQDTGGVINTGLNKVWACGVFLTSHIGSNMLKFTVSAGNITIVTEEGADGNWWAEGK